MNAPSTPAPRHHARTRDAVGPAPGESAPPGSRLPHPDHTPVDGPADGAARNARPRPPAVPPEVRLGHDAQNAQAPATRLSTPRQALPLRKVLEALGPQMAEASCQDLNHLHDIIKKAQDLDNPMLDFMATRTAIQEQRKFIELALGRTVNINQNIKSQRDVPRLDRLSPEKRAQLESLMNDLSSDAVIDIEATDVHTSTP